MKHEILAFNKHKCKIDSTHRMERRFEQLYPKELFVSNVKSDFLETAIWQASVCTKAWKTSESDWIVFVEEVFGFANKFADIQIPDKQPMHSETAIICQLSVQWRLLTLLGNSQHGKYSPLGFKNKRCWRTVKFIYKDDRFCVTLGFICRRCCFLFLLQLTFDFLSASGETFSCKISPQNLCSIVNFNFQGFFPHNQVKRLMGFMTWNVTQKCYLKFARSGHAVVVPCHSVVPCEVPGCLYILSKKPQCTTLWLFCFKLEKFYCIIFTFPSACLPAGLSKWICFRNIFCLLRHTKLNGFAEISLHEKSGRIRQTETLHPLSPWSNVRWHSLQFQTELVCLETKTLPSPLDMGLKICALGPTRNAADEWLGQECNYIISR